MNKKFLLIIFLFILPTVCFGAQGGNPGTEADNVTIDDAGNYFTGTEVETALQELGASAGESTTVTDTTTVDLTLTGSDITADAKTAAVSNGAATLTTGDQVYDFCETTQAYLTTEVDGSTTNEINTVQGDDNTATSGLAISIDGAGTVTTDVIGDVLTITGTEVDGSTSNEINTLTLPDANATAGLGITFTQAGIMAITESAPDTVLFTATEVDGSTTNEIQNLFETIACTSGTSPVADTSTDTLTLTAGANITITGDASTDTVTIASTGGGGETLAQTLALGADANDVDTTSWGLMSGFDTGLYLDWDADGVLNLSSDGTIGLSSTAATTVASTGAGVLINTHTDATDDFAVNTSMLVVEGDTGNVGIGTTSPATLTEIQGGLTTVGSILTLGTKEPSVVANDVLGRIDFYAPLDVGVDSDITAASIVAIAEDTFSDTVNATSLLFQTGASEIATTKMTLTSAGALTVTGATNIIGATTLGTATSAAGNLTLYDEGLLTLYEDGDNFSVTMDCQDGESVMDLQGGLDISGVLTCTSPVFTTPNIGAATGSIDGQAGTVATITGLAPDTQNTYSRTQYLIPYASTTTAFGEIAIGTATHVLTSNGAGAAPTFQAAAGGAVTALNNATANELVSVGATTTELDCESTLTFDGSDMVVGGTTPSITIGDAGEEDSSIIFNGNAQDYHIGLDDTDNALKLGLGATLGTTDHIISSSAGVITLPLNSGARGYLGTAEQELASSTSITKVLLNAETYDIQGEFVPYTDTAATQARFTATVAGYYQVNAGLLFNDATADREYSTYIYKNNANVAYIRHYAAVGGLFGMTISDTIYLAVGDYVELFGKQTTGDANTGFYYLATTTYLSVNKIR